MLILFVFYNTYIYTYIYMKYMCQEETSVCIFPLLKTPQNKHVKIYCN